jgi:UDP-N-acetylmuramoylalanine--D-glutamate ligase
MIYEVLQQSPQGEKSVFLGGNIRGVSTLALLPQMKAGDILVLELDSWQLQGFGDLQISPRVAVFTNLMADHQNYYATEQEYFNDKANIFTHQSAADLLIVGGSVVDRIRKVNPSCHIQVCDDIPTDWTLQIPGQHNRANAALAAGALRALGISNEHIQQGLAVFTGVEGRLQLVREINGVKIYNDNNATTPEATIAALRALDTHTKNILLIAGGADKGLDTSTLLYEIAKTCKRVIVLSGTGSSKILPYMRDYSLYDSLFDAVHEAVRGSVEGDIILFSPAFASFGLFKNEYDRNDQFMRIIKSL